VLPLPWQTAQHLALAQDQRTALYLKIDRGAKTYYLLEARFPDRLQALVRAGLVSADDLVDAQGRPLSYAVKEDSYTLVPLEKGNPVVGAEATEGITGNFLLDPSMYVSSQSVTAPIVLLD
jgi:hypothetical protein